MAVLFLIAKYWKDSICSSVGERSDKLCNIQTIKRICVSRQQNEVGSLYAAVPNLFGTRDRFCGRKFFHGLGWGGDGFRMIQAHYIYCSLYFYYYYTVIYNEIIIQLTIMQTGGRA